MDKNTSENEPEARSGTDRRHLSFTVHIPERRNGIERRGGAQKEAETYLFQKSLVQSRKCRQILKKKNKED
jgi:hypothetical protein